MKTKGAKLILLIMIFTLSLSLLAGVVTRAEGTGTSSANAGSAGRRVSDYNGKRVGVLAGTMNDTFVIKALPDAKLSYYNNISDMIAALEADKVDSIAGDEPVFSMAASENDRLELLDVVRQMAMEEITVIMSLHEIELALDVADRLILVYDDGHVLVRSPKEVLDNSMIKDLYGLDDKMYAKIEGTLTLWNK